MKRLAKGWWWVAAVALCAAGACKRSAEAGSDLGSPSKNAIPAADLPPPNASAPAAHPIAPAGARSASPAAARSVGPATSAAGRPLAVGAGKPYRSFSEKHDKGVLAVAFVPPNGERALSSSVDDVTRLWDTRTGAVVQKYSGKAYGFQSLSFSKDGTRVLTAGEPAAHYWEVATGKVLQTLAQQATATTLVALAPDDRSGATVGGDGSVVIWDVTSGKAGRRFEDAGPVRGMAFTADGRRLVWISEDDRICRAEATGDAPPKCSDLGAGRPMVAAVQPPRAVTGDATGTVVLWDTESGKKVRSWDVGKHDIAALDFAPGPGLLACASSGLFKVLNTSDGKEVAQLGGAAGPDAALAIAPGGQSVLYGTGKGVVGIWDLPAKAPAP